ncbi:hypothetical protein BDZ90DRAFT_229206 [Jaminaea rosea]|uniref:Uncharacterized protein n=1 Tax=Jaminaea rosea TaxID=1569628 RepID=A0A316V1X6_9BASI|nr:hypothetical protein BDZ90DRAFT_229206 [Jaminaea rosea]PWN30183.1 hypothetical protein BDZ90DRAFT_229206 [Jaminaea rosea]
MSESIMVEAQERAPSLSTSSSPAHSFFIDMDEPASGPSTPVAFNGILPPSHPVRLTTPLANTSDDDDKYDDAVDIQEPSRQEESKEEASFALSNPPLDADRTLIQQEPPDNTKEQRPEALTLPASPPLLPQHRFTGFEPTVRDNDHKATPREDLLTPQLEANLTLLSQHDQLRQRFLAFANDAECAVRSKDHAVLQATVSELSLRVRKVSAIFVSLTAQLNEMSAQSVDKDLGQAQKRLKAEHDRIFSDAASKQQPNVVIKDGLMLLDMLLRHLGELSAETEKQLAKATEMVRSPRFQNTGIS